MRSILRAYTSRRRWERLGVVAAIAVVGSAAIAIETTAASDDRADDHEPSAEVTTVWLPPAGMLDGGTVTHRDDVVELVLTSFEDAEDAQAATEDAAGADEPTDERSDGQVSDEVWDELAQCESTGDWSINTGNGFYGGLQFELESWEWAGGHRYAQYPHHATREQQIEIAEELLEIHPAGWGAWPACSAQLGLR